MRSGAELVAAVAAVVSVGLVGPVAVARASAQSVPDAQIDQLAEQLGGLDEQVQQLQKAFTLADHQLHAAETERDHARAAATSQEQLEARLVGQARAYAVQRYMYGSTDSTDLLAFIAALDKPADDAVWGLATLEVTSANAVDQAEQVATARAAIADRLASLESDVLQLRATRARRSQQLADTRARRGSVASRLEGVVRDLGQATVNGMTTVAYEAYRHAQDVLALEQPGCGLRWELLAAIGKTESNHGAGRLDATGASLVAIIGIPIGPDSDGGLLDGDSTRDHAVGPMQFIPSTWARWGTDANGDGKADPGNIVDAATAAGRYLCRAAGALTLKTETGVIRAILSYNPNLAYLRVVGARFEALASDLAAGWFSAATLPTPPPPDPAVPPNAPSQGRTAPGAQPLPEPPPTKVIDVQVFAAHDLATSTTIPVTEQPATCLGPSLILGGRAGFLRCQAEQPPMSSVLDPCEVAPYDATLVGCLPDPTGPPTLLRLAAVPPPPKAAALGPPPPFRLLVLDGADRCAPIPAVETTPPPTISTTTTTTSPTSTNGPTSTGPSRPPRTTTTTPSTSIARATTAPPPTDPSTTLSAPGTKAARRAARGAEASSTVATTSPPTSTTTSTTVATTTTTIPLAERPTYGCASGITILGAPDESAPTWTVRVRETGLADRQLAVIEAYA